MHYFSIFISVKYLTAKPIYSCFYTHLTLMQNCKNFRHLNFERLCSICFLIPGKRNEKWLIAELMISSFQTAAEFRILNDAEELYTVVCDAWQRTIACYQCNTSFTQKNTKTLLISVHCCFYAFVL